MRRDTPLSPLIHPSAFYGLRGFQWGVITLEYYGLIWNRRTIAAIAGSHLILFVAGGVVLSGPGSSLLTSPGMYVDPRRTRAYAGIDVGSDEMLRVHRRNRRIALTDENLDVRLDPRPKWGMGGVPHSGRLIVTTARETRELILLGRYDGEEVVRRFERAIAKARAKQSGQGA